MSSTKAVIMAPSKEFDEAEHFAFLAALDEAGTSRYFLSNVLAVLQKKGADCGLSWQEFQEQLKPDIVHHLYESAKWLWQQHSFDKTKPAGDTQVCGLYLGSMDPSIIRNGVAQALMYCDRVYVVDPFSVLLARGGDLNPLNVPQKYIFDAVLSIQEVLAISPFVAKDLVRFVPTPDLFNPELFLATQQLARQRLAKMPLQGEDYDEWASHKAPNFVRWLGTWSDEDLYLYLRQNFGDDQKTARQKIRELRKFVRKDPRRISLRPAESQIFRTHTSGLNTEMGIYAANHLNVFPFTNWKRSWRELTSYHGDIRSQPKGWFAIEQCLQRVKFPDFGSVDPKFLLQIRSDKRFQALRNALRDLWKAAGRQELDANVLGQVTEKLEAEVAKIQTQLEGLNNDYRKWLVAAGASAAGSIATVISGDIKLFAGLLTAFASTYAKAGEHKSKLRMLGRQCPMSVYFSKLR